MKCFSSLKSKIQTFFLLALIGPLMSIHAEEYPYNPALENTITYVEDWDVDSLIAFAEGCIPNAIMCIRENSYLPTRLSLKLNIKGDVFTMSYQIEPFEIAMSVHKTIFLKNTEEEMYISLDAQDWTPIEDFFTGDVECATEVVNGVSKFSVDVELNVSEDSPN